MSFLQIIMKALNNTLKPLLLCVCCVAIPTLFCSFTPKNDLDAKVDALLSKMTTEQKTCQLATLYGYKRVLKDSLPTKRWDQAVWKDGIANIDEHLNGVRDSYKTANGLVYPFGNHVNALHEVQRWFMDHCGIPVEFSNEGIHGLNHTLATPLPAPIALGSTWDRALILEAGKIAGKEASLLGYHSVYAPILDVARDQRWGRTLECYGEDPFLVAELGIQMSRGIQSQGVAAGLKHFAAYGVPKGGRDGFCRTDPHITPRELHEIFLYPFQRVIKETHPMIVMASYNDWNGEPVIASKYFLTELLRDEYGFDGYVVSDSDAVEFVQTKHQIAEDYDTAVLKCLEAGLNVRTNFTQPEIFISAVRRLVESGRLSEELLNKRVREVLMVKARLGLLDNPYTGNAKDADRLVGEDHHKEFVERTLAESMVLLKNDGILPLDKNAVKNILVTGPLADESNFMSSRYGPNGHEPVTMLKGIQNYLSGSGVNVTYKKGCDVIDKDWPVSEIIPTELSDKEKKMIGAAVNAAAESDIIIAVVGEDDKRTGESRSRTSLDLPGRQRILLQELYKTGKPIVLVLVNGQPLTINWENAKLPAIIETWFPSHKGGDVLAKALFGEINPSGKLTVTFPKSIGQIEYNFPFKKGSHGAQHKSGGNGTGYTRVTGPLYPFGYGLSYTSFEYTNMSVSKKGTEVRISCSVKNTGKYTGDEIVQLYVQDKVSSVVTYDSVLRGFERINLKPGESKTVRFTLSEDAFKILGTDMKWAVEPGEFEIRIGASSEDIRLKETITL